MARFSRQKKRKSRQTSKTKQEWDKPVFVLLIILIPVIVYLLSFSSMIYDQSFIEKKMEQSGLFFNAKQVNSYVIHYLASPDETQLIKLDVFTETEQEHLLDVKILVHRTFDALFLLLVLFFYLVYLNRDRDWRKILIYSGMLTAAVPIVLYFMPFDLVFTAFHSAFFEPGTWVFLPASALIQVYPGDFWYNISFSFFLRGFTAGWLIIILGFFARGK